MKEIQILNNGDTLYDIRRKINENFEVTKEGVEQGNTDPLAQFGVNSGNVTDGVADLLDITDATLNFKVGGEYPNLVMTSGSGVTTEIDSINPLYLQNLADGEYKILVNGEASQVSGAEFYSQLTEPQNINNGDVWFNGKEAKQYLTNAPSVTAVTPKTTINFKCMGNIGDLYIAAGGGQFFYISRDGGATWESRVLPANVSSFLSCVVKDGYFYFTTSTSSIMRTAEGEDPEVFHKFADTFYPQKIKVINDLFVLTASGPTLSTSSDGQTWNTITIGTEPIIDVFYINDLYYIISRNGTIYTSEDLVTVTQKNKIEQSTYVQCAEIYKNTIIMGGISGSLYIYNLDTDEITLNNISSSEVILDMQVRPNGAMIFVGSGNMCKITYDFTTFQNLYTSGGYLEHIYKDFIMGQAGSFLRINQTVQWFDYPWVPVGEVTISGGQVTYFITYPYNSNGLHEASSSTFGLLRTAAVTDEMDCTCNDAVITPANLYNLANYRLANTEYNVGDKVGCPYSHNLQLKCVTAGTTSEQSLDTTNLAVGDTITDGSVVWIVEEMGTGSGGSGGTGQPIGTIYSLNCSQFYIPEGSLPTDGSEYSKAQFEDLWNNYLTGEIKYINGEWKTVGNLAGVETQFSYRNLTYGNDIFVFTADNCIVSSSDGMNWQTEQIFELSSEKATYITFLKFVNNKFVASGFYRTSSETVNFIITSTDGKQWSDFITVDFTLSAITYGEELYVALDSQHNLYHSTDCQTWVSQGTITYKIYAEDGTATAYGMSATFIDYLNGQFVVSNIGGLIATSTDATDWTLASMGTDAIGQLTSMIYYDNSYVAFFVTSSGETGTNIVISEDLKNWTPIFSNVGDTGAIFSSLAVVHDGIYATAGGYCYKTNDLTTWGRVEDFPLYYANNLAYNGQTIVCVDRKGYYTSKMDCVAEYKMLSTCTYQEYQKDLDIYGQCAKFGMDVENLTFRVPFIKDGSVIQQALSDVELGKAYNASTYDSTYAVTDDSSLQKVQMNAVALRYFVVVADGTINQSKMDWSEWATGLQNKVSKDDLTEIPVIVERYLGEHSWYDLYSDGLCIQGGKFTYVANGTITLLKTYRDINYVVYLTGYDLGDTGGEAAVTAVASLTENSITLSTTSEDTYTYWMARGYIS